MDGMGGKRKGTSYEALNQQEWLLIGCGQRGAGRTKVALAVRPEQLDSWKHQPHNWDGKGERGQQSVFVNRDQEPPPGC